MRRSEGEDVPKVADLSRRLDVLEHALRIARQQRDPSTRERWLTAIEAATESTRHDLADATPDYPTRPRPSLHLVEQVNRSAYEGDPQRSDRTPAPATRWAARSRGTVPRP
ncbi:hypothetical protein TPA0905_12360 [Streptomyces olivaceus]|nr:hypothetical protein TPA0905_12360 [Streptomyces olivaceus]